MTEDETGLGSNIEEKTMVVEEEPETESAIKPKKTAVKKTAVKKTAPVGLPETTRIVLEDNESIPPTGLFVSHNGRAYLIRTGEEVDVPTHVLNVLDDAKMAMPIMDADNQQVIGWRERMRFPYRRV